MTSKAKKSGRRLQIDPDEFAPPSDIYDSSSAPRPDDAWLTFYGGKQEGQVKHLTSLDEDTSLPSLPSVADFTLPLPSSQLETTAPSVPQSSPQPDTPPEISETPTTLLPQALASVIAPLDPPQPKAKSPRKAKALRPKPAKSKKKNIRSKLTNQVTSGADISIAPITSTSSISLSSFADFALQWGHLLTFGKQDGKLRICEVIFNNTHQVGVDTFLSSYDQLATLSQLSKKSCQIIVTQLEQSGFIERIAIFNTATRKGTLFRLHLFPSPPGNRKTPKYYLYDEDASSYRVFL